LINGKYFAVKKIHSGERINLKNLELAIVF
jgi:hypothetical protein